MDNLPINTSTDSQPVLDDHAMTSLFLFTMADIYHLKTHLIDYLPLMSNKAYYRGLKRSIMDSSLDITNQIFRIDVIFKMLNGDNIGSRTNIAGNINLESYISSHLKDKSSYRTDFAMLTHLLMIEGMEVTSFRLLKKLAACLGKKEIQSLINDSLKEAVTNKRQLYDLSDKYLNNPGLLT